MIRGKIISIVLFLCLILSGCSEDVKNTGISNSLKDVSVRLPIPVMDATMTPYFVALDKGLYREEGLEVSLQMGSSETNPVKMVSAGADSIGVLGGPDTLLIARSKGIPLVAVAVLHRNSDFPILITLENSGISKVEELEGKKIGFFYGHISTDVIRYLLKQEEINYEEVNVGLDFSQLLTGKIDAMWAFKTHGPINLHSKGYEVNIISPKDYGVNTHGLTFFTTEEMIEHSPEIVERWLRATFKGINFIQEYPDESLASVLARDPKLTLSLERKKLDQYMALVSDSEEYPIGYMDYEMFKETYDRLHSAGLIEEEFNVEDAFTTNFLEIIHSKSFS